jgi:hypothetical protein
VVLDGTDLGPPIVRRPVKPGPHQLRIDPLSGPGASATLGAGAIDQQVDVPEGKKLVLTFDLASGQLQQVVGELPAP